MPDFLVKLASFGTSGVCICAIFYCGVAIARLPKDPPLLRVQLIRRYMNICVFIAMISAVSGGVNAYFNQNKIEVAQRNEAETKRQYALLQRDYNTEMVRIAHEKTQLADSLRNVATQLKDKGLQPANIQDFARMKEGVEKLQLKPLSEIKPNPQD